VVEEQAVEQAVERRRRLGEREVEAGAAMAVFRKRGACEFLCAAVLDGVRVKGERGIRRTVRGQFAGGSVKNEEERGGGGGQEGGAILSPTTGMDAQRREACFGWVF
jgi:hypothetical protein